MASQLRHASKSSADRSPLSHQRGRSPDSIASTAAFSAGGSRARPLNRRCTVVVNEGYSPDDVLLNFDLVGGDVRPGQLVSITVVMEKEKGASEESQKQQTSGGDSQADKSTSGANLPGLSDSETYGKRYVFVAKDMPPELKTKHPNVEIFVVKPIADNFGMKKGTSVVLAPISPSNPIAEANFVELTFRDQYLSRSDMWRMAIAEMTERTVYRGQSLLFMGTIKATVTSIFTGKEKVHSAFFTRNTRPVFRSESARYVLFIQMAREMWDFDAEGSGEIMFNKVVNGFLPALFKKWALLKAHHRVTIVLFARVEYEFGISDGVVPGELGGYYTGIQPSGERRPYKDFYRVVVSEMASGEWTKILYQLKKEFNYFRRDISINHLKAEGVLPEFQNTEERAAKLNQIKAESSFAMYGNLLEAISMASSQFAHDYIDRDLNHTGISLVIITPGPGVFEVEYETLRKTTESLIGNGIGIDLVCVPKLPLHSVPLFRYRTRQLLEDGKERWIRSRESTPRGTTSIVGSYVSTTESVSPSKTVMATSGHMRRVDSFASTAYGHGGDEWSYAVPQWLHVAFWTGTSEEALSYQGIVLAVAGSGDDNDDSKANHAKDFMIRCRMYGLQMRSVLETNEIDTAPLLTDPAFPSLIIESPLTGKNPKSWQKSEGGILHVPEVKPFDTLNQPVTGMTSFRTDKPPHGANRKNDYRKSFGMLAEYDNSKCKLPPRRTPMSLAKISRDFEETSRRHHEDSSSLFGSSVPESHHSMKVSGLGASGRKMSTNFNEGDKLAPRRENPAASSVLGNRSGKRNVSPAGSTMSRSTSRTGSSAKAPRFMRGISLGQHGFGMTAPKATVAEPVLETVMAVAPPPEIIPQNSANHTASQWSLAPLSVNPQPARADNSSTFGGMPSTPSIPIMKRGLGSMTSLKQLNSESLTMTPRPTATRTSSTTSGKTVTQEPTEVVYSQMLYKDVDRMYNYKLRMGVLPNMQHSSSRIQELSASPVYGNSSNNNNLHSSDYSKKKSTAAVSPWLMLLNPSNPDVSKFDDATRYRSWQHVFPQTSRMRVMNWKALCCPAAVPLTTEYFPTQKEFESDWQSTPYNIAQNGDDDFLPEDGKTREEFLRELISLRFSQGFQIVIGPAVARAFGQKMLKVGDIFSKDSRLEDGTSIFMSSGNSIHQLSCSSGTDISVNIFTRKLDPTVYSSSMPAVYKPAIRTLFDTAYEDRGMDIIAHKPDLNWNQIDSFLAGHSEEMMDALRFWRARFVLIPVVAPQDKLGEGDNAEEIRLEGIRRLAQLWQRYRIVAASERPFMPVGASRRRRDPNPLDIVYKTEDPSAVVSAEYDTLPLVEGPDGSRKGQLISRREGFRRATLNLAALAEAIQQPVELGGVRMQNRRWHLRTHNNSFIGSDMTTWLLDNFDDLENRQAAEELGNALMVTQVTDSNQEKDKDKDKDKERDKEKEKEKERGLFVHVQHRHPFRDGQYFYQIAPEFAKPSSQSWFNTLRKEKEAPSVPSTPYLGATGLYREPTVAPGQSREESSPTALTPTGNMPFSIGTFPSGPMAAGRMQKQRAKPKPVVMLSKMMKYDVDHRRRSYRPERINLHYDRLHNPDNCYHLRIDWLNTTAKLLEDAIDGWAREAANYGLRLVEVPISEASAITSQNPFRRPFKIELPSEFRDMDKPLGSTASSISRASSRPETPYLGASQIGQHAPPVSGSAVCSGKTKPQLKFQREILRHFDFVLDVEAASNFPTSVDVRYSWGKPDYKYSQYIHNSGCVLAQITDDGALLLLENHLFSNRGATKERALAADRAVQSSIPAHMMATHGPVDSPRLKPTFRNSPLIKPAFTNPTDSEGAAGAPTSPGGTKQTTPAATTTTTFVQVKENMVAFCNDAEELMDFWMECKYGDYIAPPSPGATPSEGRESRTSRQSRRSSVMSVREDHRERVARGALDAVPDANIPSLGLPPGVLDLSELDGSGGLGPGLASASASASASARASVSSARGGLSPRLVGQTQIPSPARLGTSMALGMSLLRRGSTQIDPKNVNQG